MVHVWSSWASTYMSVANKDKDALPTSRWVLSDDEITRHSKDPWPKPLCQVNQVHSPKQLHPIRFNSNYIRWEETSQTLDQLSDILNLFLTNQLRALTETNLFHDGSESRIPDRFIKVVSLTYPYQLSGWTPPVSFIPAQVANIIQLACLNLGIPMLFGSFILHVLYGLPKLNLWIRIFPFMNLLC